jgi:hypothetical protein
MLEEQTLTRHAVKGRCFDPALAVGAGMRPPIIGNGKEDVGRRLGRWRHRRAEKGWQDKDEQEQLHSTPQRSLKRLSCAPCEVIDLLGLD